MFPDKCLGFKLELVNEFTQNDSVAHHDTDTQKYRCSRVKRQINYNKERINTLVHASNPWWRPMKGLKVLRTILVNSSTDSNLKPRHLSGPKRERNILKWMGPQRDLAGFGIVGGHVGDVLNIWPNEVVQRVQVGGEGGPWEKGSTLSEAKPGSLWTCGPVPSPAATPRVCPLIAQGDHHTLQHIQVHFGVDFQADFEDVSWHDVTLTWNHTNDHNRSWKLCFHHHGHVPVIHGNPDLHFEGAGNGPVVITWISREDELYSGASPISLVEHCVTFRHDRRLLSLLGFVHNWPTSRWSATKKESWFS